MVQPELPQLIEALQICSNLLLYNSPQHPDKSRHIERGPSITLPVSSGKLEELKGIVVRDGAYVTQMAVLLRERHFNRIITRLHLTKPFLLPQILTAKRSIDLAVELLVQASSLFDAPDEACDANAHDQLQSVFEELLAELQTAKNALQLPTDPHLVFPLHVTAADFFDPPLAPNIALDLYISQAEVCIDLKDLHRVTERPWSDIDSSLGKSYVDQLRDKMSAGIVDKDVMELTLPAEKPDRGVFENVLNHLQIRPRLAPHDYVTRCVTYNNMVVMVDKKIEVSSADPVLVSAFTKLDLVEFIVSSFLENIRKLAGK